MAARRATCCPARTTTCRRASVRARIPSRSRPTAARLPSSRSPIAVEATSTNGDLFEVPVAGGAARKLTTNPGFDSAPAYSPDGKWLAYRSQPRNGYEADKWRLMVLDRASGRSTSLTDTWDRSVENPVLVGDSRTIYFNAEDRGAMPVFPIPVAGGQPRAPHGRCVRRRVQPRRGRTLVVSRSSLAAPSELFAVPASGPARAMTHQNQKLLAELDLAKPESFTFHGAGNAEVQGYLIRRRRSTRPESIRCS